MEKPEFQIIEHTFDLPFRARNVYDEYIIFQAGDLDVYLDPRMPAHVQDCASRALPCETGGLLAGRILRDDAGPYVVVTGMAVAPPGAGDVSMFNLTPGETERLRRELSARYPSADVIGWWHSHRAPSDYSSTDRRNQAMWTDPRHLGLLVFASGTPWASLYVGPECGGPFWPGHQLSPGHDRGSRPDGRGEHAQSADRQAGPRARDDTAYLVRLARKPRLAPRALAALAALIALVAGALVVKLLAPGSVVREQFAWSCVVAATSTATCHANSKDPMKWYLSGTLVGSGSNVTFPLRRGRRNDIRVVVADSTGSYTEQQALEPAKRQTLKPATRK